MTLINLLPHREVARKRRREAFLVSLLAAALLGGVVSGLIYTAYQAHISSQNETNAFLQAQAAKLDKEIKEVSTLQAEIVALRARQTAVESLQADRNLPVYLLAELAQQLPGGMYLSSMKQDEAALSLAGTAQSQESVSEFLRNLANNSQWFARPELIEVVAATIALTPREQRRVSNFSIRVQVLKPGDVQKPAAGVFAAQPRKV